MKVKVIFFILLNIIFTISGNAQSQLYYWSAGEKQYLYTDRSSIIISPKPNENIDLLRGNIQTHIQSQDVSKLHSGKLLLIRTNEDVSDIETIKRSNSAIGAAAFGLKLHRSGPSMYLTGEILLQLRKETVIDNILSLIKSEYDSYESRKHNTYKIKVVNWDNILDIANKIYESNLVTYCHPNFIAPIQKHQVVTPTDELYPQQYYLNQANNIDINAPQAWGLSRGINNVRVAVIDDGVEAHEDMNGRVLLGFTPSDPNGQGAPTNNLPPPNLLEIGHGQACAGIIAATHDNVGIAGISPCSQIIPINIFNDWIPVFDFFGNIIGIQWQEDALDIRDAIDWAWDDGEADVISNSWGYNTVNPQDNDPNAPGFIPNFDEIIFAINRARTQGRGGLGSVVVFSSGNFHQQFNGVTFPANVNGVITVGAINQNGNIWNYSSRGPEMDLVAPSGNLNLQGDVTTTDRMNGNGYEAGNYTDRFGGTSAAAPQVSGVAALMLSINPNLTETQVRTILQQTATDMGASGFDNTFGFGRLNAHAAIQAVMPTITSSSLAVCTNGTTFTLNNVPAGVTVTWTATPANLFQTSSGTLPTGVNTLILNAANNNVSGQGTITFTITTGCGNPVQLQTFAWVGLAQSLSFTASYNQSQGVMLSTPYVGGGATAMWSVNGTQHAGFDIFVQPLCIDYTNIPLEISLTVENQCDLKTVCTQYMLKCPPSPLLTNMGSCGGGGGGEEPEFHEESQYSVSPNPASRLVNVAVVPVSGSIKTNVSPSGKTKNTVTIQSIVLTDMNGQVKYSSEFLNEPEKVQIDISHLMKGIYILKISNRNYIESHRIVVE
ncbi:MAG: S8 family peptidase [Cyclobacteriaceae bacterium]|nr:S8 family peptidase [Cyclobacteriaceae bacterium]